MTNHAPKSPWRIALVREIGVRGLVNAQFIVREEGIYLIEVNPRASRTVPFMSKVTGIPMVPLAVDIAIFSLQLTEGCCSCSCNSRFLWFIAIAFASS